MCNVVYFTIFLLLPSLVCSQSTTSPTVNLPQECACNASKIWLDIIVAVDTSSSMTLQGLSVVQGFLSGIFESLSVSQGVGQYTRLGIVGFAANATVFNYLTDINSTDQALSAIRAIQYDGGDQVNLIPAFQTVQEVISTSDKRPNVKNLILIVTTACTDDPTPIAHQLKALDNVIVTLAYGQVDETPPPILTFASSGFNFTNKDVNLTQEILAAFCDSNCFCPSPRWRQFIDSTSKKYGECLYQGDIPTTWLEAQLTCESKLGYLMDELSSEKHYFVKKLAIAENIQPLAYWIGLTNKNGIWGWDRGINSTLPLTSNDYTNWAAGNPTDANNCTGEVQTLGFNVQWKTMACTTTLASDFRVYFCQVRACDTDNYCLDVNAQTTASTGTAALTTTTWAPSTAMTTTTTTTTVSTPSASPTTPINPDCDLSQLLYDVALVFDVGEIATIDTNRLLNYAKNVALLFSANFTIGSKGGQFALLQYGDARGAWTWADFKTYGSHNALNSHINGSVRGSGQGPNDLDKAFEQIYEYFIAPGPEPGVRPNARHMVIFFSTQSPANLTAAISAAKTLRNATFCTVGIASGGVDISRVVGGANFATALNSPNDIPTVVQWLRHFVCTQPACPP